MYDIITFGSATRDIVVTSKAILTMEHAHKDGAPEFCLPLGSKIDIEEIHFVNGGGGMNTAATFVKQGFKTAFCGMVGHDTAGQEILAELKRRKIDSKFVSKKKDALTNHSIVILGQDEERTILAYRGASELLEEKDIPFKKLQARWLYLAPLSGITANCFEPLVDFAKNQKIKVAVNPGMAELSLPHFPEIAKKIDILIVNEDEASFLTKVPTRDGVKLFEALCRLCPGVVIMTQGPKGVLVSDGKDWYRAHPHEHRVVADTTGAGDSFASGFVSDFMKTGAIETAIQLGMANAEACLTEVGAQNGLLEKGQEFDKVLVEKLGARS